MPSDPLQPGGTLSDVAQSLAQKSALLEPDQLSQADARLATLLQRFNEIPESLQKLPDMSKVRKIFYKSKSIKKVLIFCQISDESALLRIFFARRACEGVNRLGV